MTRRNDQVILPSIHDLFPEFEFMFEREATNSPAPLHCALPDTKGQAKPRLPPKKHYCNICRRGVNRPSNLAIHMNIHTGAMPYTCPHHGCGRAFNVKANMQRHYRNHTQAHNPGSDSSVAGPRGAHPTSRGRIAHSHTHTHSHTHPQSVTVQLHPPSALPGNPRDRTLSNAYHVNSMH